MIKARDLNGETVYDIIGFDYEEDLELICNNLSRLYAVEILDKTEGPGTTIWKVEISGYSFVLVNNSWGSFLKPSNQESNEFIEIQNNTLNSLLSEK